MPWSDNRKRLVCQCKRAGPQRAISMTSACGLAQGLRTSGAWSIACPVTGRPWAG